MTILNEDVKQSEFDSEVNSNDLQDYLKVLDHLKNSLGDLAYALSKLFIVEKIMINKENLTDKDIEAIIKNVFYTKN